MSRYRAIADYLANLRKSSVRLSFTKIEQLIGAKLPKSASRYAAWWANSKSKDSHTWAHEWRRAGWKTAHLDLPGRAVTFHRLRQAKRPKRAKHAIRLISVNKNYWDGIPEKHQEVTEALLPMAKNEVPYTFTGKSSPKLAGTGALGFASPRICVQVKSQESPVGRPEVDQLIGAMDNTKADAALFVAWGGFKPTVYRELANRFFRVRLWTQKELLEQLFSTYEKLDEDLRAEVPLKRVWTVAAQDDE